MCTCLSSSEVRLTSRLANSSLWLVWSPACDCSYCLNGNALFYIQQQAPLRTVTVRSVQTEAFVSLLQVLLLVSSELPCVCRQIWNSSGKPETLLATRTRRFLVQHLLCKDFVQQASNLQNHCQPVREWHFSSGASQIWSPPGQWERMQV